VGEVDEAQYAVDQRVAKGDERVDRAERQAVEGLCAELVLQAGEAVLDVDLLDGRGRPLRGALSSDVGG
jgi:hypothetical protein